LREESQKKLRRKEPPSRAVLGKRKQLQKGYAGRGVRGKQKIGFLSKLVEGLNQEK